MLVDRLSWIIFQISILPISAFLLFNPFISNNTGPASTILLFVFYMNYGVFCSHIPPLWPSLVLNRYVSYTILIIFLFLLLYF